MKSFLYTLIFITFGAVIVSGQSSPKNKKFHIINNTSETWHKALHHCMIRGWRLASIDSKQENEQLIKQIRDTGVLGHHWTAGTNIGNEPYFYWMGHDQPLTFNDWHHGEPNNYHLNEDCIELKYWDDIFKWNDTQCSSKLFFICEETIET